MPKSSFPQDIRPENILTSHTPEVQQLAQRLRTLVRTSVPQASEKAYPHWHGIGYRHPTSGYFCAIFPHPERVDLSFEYGILLPDPHHLLVGSGSQVRYVSLSSSNDLPEEALKSLILSALDLPDGREVKLTLIRNISSRSPDA